MVQIGRTLLIPIALAVAGCSPGPPLHVAPSNLAPETNLLCMAPSGRRAEWVLQLDRIRGERTGICRSPARFVAISPCRQGQRQPDEVPELWAARARDAADGSLVGDGYLGIPYCLRPEPR